MSSIANSFENVTVKTKANIYFDGKAVSHTVIFADGSEKTLGLIFPGEHHFGTVKAERMEVVAGEAKVVHDGSEDCKTYNAGTYFDVPAKSGFTVTVSEGVCEYICSYID